MRKLLTFAILVALARHHSPVLAITFATVPVGNSGNAGDVQPQGTFGAVAYNYRIGTSEVTLGQYTGFLNAVAVADTYSLYNTSMATNPNVAGISRSGDPGRYSYSVIGSADRPVTYVSWADAARFANWLHNGQPTGSQGATTTEDGAYTLNGAMTSMALSAVSRNPAAKWFIPSENEWYKAAYHKNDGATGNYWNYPTSTDSVPYSDQPPGSDAPTQSNTANYYKNDGGDNDYDDGFAVSASSSFPSGNVLTDAGAYTLSESPYGTFDQAGNAFEWTEALISGAFRSARGGSWILVAQYVSAADRGVYSQSYESSDLGFRVAAVPEPGTAMLAIVGMVGVAFVRRWYKRQPHV